MAGKVVMHPPIPPAPRPHPSIQSVPWQLGHVAGRRVSVRWVSGTCDPQLKHQVGGRRILHGRVTDRDR